MTRQAIIFDFDGLILDTESPQVEIWHELFARTGAEFDLKAYHSTVGGYNSDVYRPEVELAKLLNDGRSPEELLLQVQEAQLERIRQNPINPGVIEVLDDAMQRGIITTVGSSSPCDWVQGHLKRLGLFDRFETVVTYDDVSEPKPSPEIFKLVLKRLNLKAEDVIVLEDSANGVLAAHRANLRVVAVPNAVTEVMDFSLASEVLSSLLELDLNKYF